MAVQIDRAAFAVECEKTGRARIGRGTLRPTPKCNDLPPSPIAGEYPGFLVAMVEPGGESRAQAWLWHQSKVRTWLPSSPVRRSRGLRRTKTVVQEPMIRGYLLVPSLYVDHAAVLAAPGIHNYMRRKDDSLIVIPDLALRDLHQEERRRKSENSGFINSATGKPYRKGELVEVGNRILIGVIAEIERIDESGRACLWAGSVRITNVPVSELDPA